MGMYKSVDLCGLTEIQSHRGFIHFMLSQEKISNQDCPQIVSCWFYSMIQELHIYTTLMSPLMWNMTKI